MSTCSCRGIGSFPRPFRVVSPIVRRPLSTSRSRACIAVVAALAVVLASPRRAAAQACCAGAAAVTPARLAVHEDALVGVQARTSDVFGSFFPDGTYVAAPAGATEWDLEQDVFGAIRVAPRAQVALLVP